MTTNVATEASSLDAASISAAGTDQESIYFLSRMAEQERTRVNRVPGVRTVLVVLSAAGMVFDVESLRQKILLSYSDATVFFLTTRGKPIGASPPPHVDMLIDLTGPRQRQGFLYSKKLRRSSRVAVGRNAGWFRKKIYDRVFDEKAKASELPNATVSFNKQNL